MLNLSDQKFLIEVVADAVAQTHLSYKNKETRNRWIKAIAKAASVILEGDTSFLHWEPQTQTLFFWSADSDEIYQTGDTCQCPASRLKKPQPCYHRAMRLIIKNYFDFLGKPGEIMQIDFADAVFFDPGLAIRQKIDLLNLSILDGRTELLPRVEALKRHLSNTSLSRKNAG